MESVSEEEEDRMALSDHSELKEDSKVQDVALNEAVCVVAAEEYTDSERRTNLSGKVGNMQARYWSYLFDNLHRAIDEIYCTCEADESIIECQEVIMTLDVCKKDFEALINQIKIQKAFCTNEDDERPFSIAWEVRRSPGKVWQSSFASFIEQQHQVTSHQHHKSSPSRNLFNDSSPHSPSPSSQSSDKVNRLTNKDSPCNSPREYSPGREALRNRRGNISVTSSDKGLSPPPVSPSRPRESRSPGRAAQLHQKLSSPLRKRSLSESMKMLEEKQLKAQLHRNRMHEEIAQRARIISEKIRDVRECRDSKTMERKEAMETRLVKAEKLRESRLQEIVRKAHEEDAKVNEIAFITTLEAQNKKIEVLEKHQGVEARLQDIEGERLKKREEHLAKEEAAQERRRAMEAERKAKLLELDQKRRMQDAKIEQKKVERDRQREEAAKERERRLEARHAALVSSAEQLEKKIQEKHDKSSKLYGQQIEQKKEKAMSVSVFRNASSDYAPRVEAYQKKKWCSVCNVKIISEVYLMSHLRGKKHREGLLSKGISSDQVDESLSVIVLAPEEIQRQTVSVEVQERLKSGKKRCKKIRQRMSGWMRESESLHFVNSNSKYQSRFTKLIKDINRLMDTFNKHKVWDPHDITHVEKALGELNRILSAKNKDDQSSFCQLGGLASLSRLLLMYLDPAFALSKTKSSNTLPLKPLLLSLGAMESDCSDNTINSQYFVMSNKFTPVVDLVSQYFVVLSHQIETTGGKESTMPPGVAAGGNKITWVNVCATGLSLVAVVLSNAIRGTLDQQLIRDCVSYIVSSGLIDSLSEYLRTIIGPFEDLATTQLVMSSLNLLTACTAGLHFDVKDVFTSKLDDPTLLVCTLKQTELAGILSLLYALLLHNGPPRHSFVPPLLSSHILSITTAAIKALNNTAILALVTVQNSLAAEGISLELRHVLSYLLWYCTHHKQDQLLHELILAVGYFSVLHQENQLFLLSGRSPTLLQLLCGLPFEYFSDPKLSKLLYPTLIAACYNVYDNKIVMELDLNSQLLCVYLQTQISESESSESLPSKGKLLLYDPVKVYKDVKDMDFMAFKYRFPKAHWHNALKFFCQDI